MKGWIKMGIASLVLGIISLITSWIPFICFIALILAVIGLILGIVDVIKKNKTNAKNKGLGIAGLTFSAISIPIIIIMSCVTIGIIVAIVEEDGITDYNRNDYSYDYDWDDDWYNDDWYDKWEQKYYNRIDNQNFL